MLNRIDGSTYVEILNSGIKNLEKHRSVLNDLNVFPVPDGDTGTNMVMTLRFGFNGIKNREASISEVASQFASSAVFGARGNSGVIVSQFFKGMAQGFAGKLEATPEDLAIALESAWKLAYSSVAQPVEGTILTIVREASCETNKKKPYESIDALLNVYLFEASASLKRTPELLPILKKANVVDSGAAGIVYFFEGVKKYLLGEEIEIEEEKSDEEKSEEAQIDLSLFNKSTSFDYGYCTEGLIQLKKDVSDFDFKDFKRDLTRLGDSVVASLEGDKVKIHIHTRNLGRLFEFCQKHGEFLTVKVDNMTVQNMQKEKEKKDVRKFMYSSERECGEFAVVAVASNPDLQELFFDMGADIVILSEIAPSSQDFMDAFALTEAKNILVFPNSSNSILTSMQAGSLYKKSRVIVLNCRSIPECYASLSVMDFEATLGEAFNSANDTIANLYQLSIYHAIRDIRYGSKSIKKDDFFALSHNKILGIGDTVEDVLLKTVKNVMKEREYNVLTLYYGRNIVPEFIDHLVKIINESEYDIEVATVSTMETVYEITVTFE